jgi:multidrug efflux pump subunit AcrA (membrane-fusion protein)
MARFASASLSETHWGVWLHAVRPDVYVKGGAKAEAARLPLTALFQKGNEPAVWVIDPTTGQATLRPVQVGRYTQDYVTIASGLTNGELVVRAGVHKLNQGEKVRILTDAAK